MMTEGVKIFKRLFWFVIAFVAMLVYVMPAFAVKTSNVSLTKHNLSISAPTSNWYSTDEAEICIFCHTPHNANVAYPLWNQYSTTMTFAVYTSATLTPGVHDGTLPADSVSRLCLSCHEGTTAINSLVNVGVLGTKPTMLDGYDSFDDLGTPPGVGIYLSDDLTHMHPIGFDYVNARAGDPEINDILTPKGKGLRFYGALNTFLECATCHDPHVNGEAISGGDPAYEKFLRMPNTSSAMCLACHDK